VCELFINLPNVLYCQLTVCGTTYLEERILIHRLKNGCVRVLVQSYRSYPQNQDHVTARCTLVISVTPLVKIDTLIAILVF
jgi:hypothetical protein